MTPEEYQELLNRGTSPSLSEFHKMEAHDSNAFWRLSDGDHQNLLDEALEQNASLRGKLEEIRGVARKLEWLPSRYTRAYGENGDRVADLLTYDASRAGYLLREILDRGESDE